MSRGPGLLCSGIGSTTTSDNTFWSFRLAASGIDLDGGNARRIVGGRHIAPGDTERRYDLVPEGDLRQPGSDLDNVAVLTHQVALV